VNLTIDTAALPAAAQKILDPSGPAPLKQMAAKGVVPGLKPGETLAVVVALSLGADGVAEQAQKTLENLPTPLLNGALAGDLQPAVLDKIGPILAKDAVLAEKILNHAAIAAETVVTMAGLASEGVCELIATNEERLLAHPAIIEKLYLNKRCRMSTADRILELAVRHKIELNIPAYAQAAAAIAGELIAEPSEEPTFDDEQFEAGRREAEALKLLDGEDTHALDEMTGQETVVEKAKPLMAIWMDLRPPSKIRLIQLATLRSYDEQGNETETRFDAKAIRMLGVRDANSQVALAAIKGPGISENDIQRIAAMRNVCEEVLSEISRNPTWTKLYQVKRNLVANPRTPFGQAAKWIQHLYEADLKGISKSRDVPGAVKTAALQQLSRKGK
jgi:hypothetical protein